VINETDIKAFKEQQVSQITATLIEHMGDDLTVVNAARVSFNQQSEDCGWDITMHFDGNTIIVPILSERDTKLIRYLAKHKHMSPFGHCFASFHIKAPVFVRAQLVKHEYLRMNEISRRYVDYEPEFYVPDVWRGKPVDKKQGSSGIITTSCVYDLSGEVTHPKYAAQDVVDAALSVYKSMIAAGVAPEMARMVLPQNMITEWYWSGSLDAFANMCNLRLASDAQEETRYVAQQISDIMGKLYPVSWKELVQ
jgi:thymidylate synthase (FAD)